MESSETARAELCSKVFFVFQLNADDRVPKMAEDFSSDHLKLFPLHDDVITRSIPIDDEYRLKMIYHLIWLREKATMYVSLSLSRCRLMLHVLDIAFVFVEVLSQVM